MSTKKRITKFKKDNSNRVLTIKGERFIPFLLGKLPKNYNEIAPSDQFNLKGLTYISATVLATIGTEFMS